MLNPDLQALLPLASFGDYFAGYFADVNCWSPFVGYVTHTSEGTVWLTPVADCDKEIATFLRFKIVENFRVAHVTVKAGSVRFASPLDMIKKSSATEGELQSHRFRITTKVRWSGASNSKAVRFPG